MRAIQFRRFGTPDVFELVHLPIPNPGQGQVLVRVHTAGINFADTLMRQNRFALTPELPSILGHEVTGVIESLGEGVSGPEVGTRVAAPLFAAGAFFGGYAEYVAIDADFVVPLPDSISFEVATALMVQGLTALYLVRHASPRGKRVLINAAAGGVGSLLVQLAKRAGAKSVIAGASTHDKIAFACSLGADTGINYTEDDWPNQLYALTDVQGPNIIYESVGGAVTTASLNALAPLGQLVIYGALNMQSFNLGVPELLGLIFKNQSITGFAVAPLLNAENVKTGLAELFTLAARNELQVTIGGSFPLEQASNAHAAFEARGTIGKLVLTMQ
jgi:NADPH2:quinone reductase